jgi:hypothetical protein
MLRSNGRHPPVFERAGPTWHLLGTVRRDKFRRDALMLTRPSDLLSANIKAMIGIIIPIVQVTGYSGTSANLFNARITGINRPNFYPPSQRPPASHSGCEQENIQFCFSHISVVNPLSSNSCSDDWT